MNIRNPILIPSFLCALCCLLTGPVYAQIPRINTLFPIGGKTGTTVEVELRGASLAGAEQILVTGKGVAGSVSPDWAKSDDRYKPVWQSKCGSCHELRSPANRSLTPAQWAATVDRMVRVRNAPLSADEINKVTQFLSSGARVGKVVAKITIADDAQPGIHELRALTPKAISTACFFEVGSLPEITAANGKKDQPQRVTLPCVANGCMTGTAERHFFQFTAKKAQRYVFNLKGFRYSEPAQMYFNPNLRLYDQTGKEIMENHGYYDLDPVIDALPESVDMVVLRIVQETLQNVRKHAQATHVAIRARREGEDVVLDIHDDGRGFRQSGVKKSSHRTFGIQFMGERAESIGAHFEVRSQPGDGTTVRLVIPGGAEENT